MADYSLVVNSQYDPFSLQEFMAVNNQWEQAHQQIEDAYGELSTKASIWENMANSQTDKRTYQQYKNYANGLKAQADQLAQAGLNSVSRKALMDMKSRYASEITPIEQAYARREQLAKEQREGRAKGLVYDYDAGTTSLDKFVFDNQADYRSADKKDVYNKAINTFGALAKSLSDYGKGKPLDAFTNTFVQEHGITREQAARFINDIRTGNIDGSDPTLRSMYNALYNSTGVQDWDNKQAQSEISNTILDAVSAGIGQTQISTFANQGAIMAANLANQMRMARYQKGLDNPEPTGAGSKHWASTLDPNAKDASSVYNTVKKLHGMNGKRGLSTKYSGSKFNNPLALYEEVQRYAKEHPEARVKPDSNRRGEYRSKEDLKNYKGFNGGSTDAEKIIAKKYGASEIISKEDYENLKKLGYTADTPFEQFSGTVMDDIYNNYYQAYSPSDLNASDYSDYSDRISAAISARQSMGRTGGTMYSRWENGKQVKYEDIFGEKGSDKITSVAYDFNSPNTVAIRTKNGEFNISPDYISSEAASIINRAAEAMSNATIFEKSQIQDRVAKLLEAEMNAFNKGRSKTDSKR